jgi:hypothetical protein
MRVNMKITTAACLTALVVLAGVTVACAESAWVLALPPLRAPTAGTEGEAPRTPIGVIAGSLDRQAPISEWRPSQTFPEGGACEDARLTRGREFHDAVEAVGDGTLSDADRARLTKLAQEAFGRCVPAFAFSPEQKG